MLRHSSLFELNDIHCLPSWSPHPRLAKTARLQQVPGSQDSASLNRERRQRDLESLVAGEHLDVIVIGGGITGVGAALDAAARGLSVALIERHDLASGTSSKRSRLVHGGVRSPPPRGLPNA